MDRAPRSMIPRHGPGLLALVEVEAEGQGVGEVSVAVLRCGRLGRPP